MSYSVAEQWIFFNGHQERCTKQNQWNFNFLKKLVILISFILICFIITRAISTKGLIDSTDICLTQPLKHLPAYTNRKSVTSVKLQVVANAKKKLIDVSCGWPGSMHDSRIFQMSSLSGVIEEKLNGTDYHLLGDSAYPLGIRMMKPYTNNGHLDPVILFTPAS